ncbi:hypothetical protein CR513_21553, partial [Mucuna pruriens]
MLALAAIPNSTMEPTLSSAQHQNLNEVVATGKKPKRLKNSCRVKKVRSRVYNPAIPKTCHQFVSVFVSRFECRQKTSNYSAPCKNEKKGKLCPLKFCHNCLKTRCFFMGGMGRKQQRWHCWINGIVQSLLHVSFFSFSSVCVELVLYLQVHSERSDLYRKKRGKLPTGPLYHQAKASGFNCVFDMLVAEDARNSGGLESNNSGGSESNNSGGLELNNPGGLELNNPGGLELNNSVGLESNNPGGLELNNPGVSHSNLSSPTMIILSTYTRRRELGELGKGNSSDVNSGLKLDPVNDQKESSQRISKITKCKEPKEISMGSNADGAGKRKSRKRPKICKVPSEEAKGKAKYDTEVCNKVSEKETKVDTNYDAAHVPMDGAEAWAANDFCLDINNVLEKVSKGKSFSGVQHKFIEIITVLGDPPSDFVVLVWLQKFISSIIKYHDMKHMHCENWNKTVLVNGDGDNKFQAGMAKFPNVGMNLEIEKIEEEIPLPPGTELTEILDIEFPPEDAGSALQLLEFCSVFGKVLDLKNGEAEAMLRELVCKRSFSSGQKTLVVQFQIRVLTLILTDSRNGSPSLTARNGNNSWLKPLKNLITESYLVPNDFPLDWLQEGIDGYYNLDLSKKLTLLNFLCDEALVTRKLRSYIEEQHLTHVKEVKETKSKVAAAKKKEKDLKQKLENEMAKAFTSNVAPLSMEEHKALLTKMKGEVAQAHTEMLELKGTTPKGKPSVDAMRTNPEFLDSNGQAFWKLKSYNDEHAVLLQDIKILDETATATAPDEKWFVYGPEKKDEVDKYISSRAKRLKSIEWT